MDVVVSNCVVNLSPRKELVLQEVFRVLKPGGEFYFSDVFVDRRLKENIAFDPLLHSECLGGALYVRDFTRMAKKAGFKDPRVLTGAPISIRNEEIEKMVGNAKFSSITYRLFKIDTLVKKGKFPRPAKFDNHVLNYRTSIARIMANS